MTCVGRRFSVWLQVVVCGLAVTPTANAQGPGDPFVLHEPIPADPREDMELGVSLDGDLPAAIVTRQGLLQAPDPAKAVGTADAPYTRSGDGPRDGDRGPSFRPDRDTRRPDVMPYDDPFTPSTSPFKRLTAFDSVDASYSLSVRGAQLSPLSLATSKVPEDLDDLFYADLVVDLEAGRNVRIPSVGPGARVLRARVGVGTQDVPFQLWKDGADNWFIEGESSVRARVVMELSLPRAASGGDFGRPSWSALPPVPSLPPPVRRAAADVMAKVGLTRRLSPRENLDKLVGYFRAFVESAEPLASSQDIYLDLALSQKGVCRHRAFAFMVTALALGLPTRMVLNEAHAWVEVHDGHLWRRIDLGGAGQTLHDPLSSNVPYEPAPDPFAWPASGNRGTGRSGSARQERANADPAPVPISQPAKANSRVPGASDGELGTKAVTLSIGQSSAHRRTALNVRGRVTRVGEPCADVAVQILLRSPLHPDVMLGQVATDAAGSYEASIVIPRTTALGDYEAEARVLGNGSRSCGDSP